MNDRIEQMLALVDEPHRTECLEFIEQFRSLFDSSKGSAIKHQAWPGGYRDHITEVMEIACRTYQSLEVIRELPFSLSDALFGCFLHDIEKMWKHTLDPEESETVDKGKTLSVFFTLNEDHQNAVKYAHGEGDDYHPTDRIQSPLAAFVHHCDNTSARIWFDKPDGEDRSIPTHRPCPYTDSLGNEWDLDNSKTYTDSWFEEFIPLSVSELSIEIENRIAHSLYYMDCWDPDWECWKDQRKRVLEFGKRFALEIRKQDRLGDKFWLRKQLFLILDEVENQC